MGRLVELNMISVFVIVVIALLVFYLPKLFRFCDRLNEADWGNRWLNRVDGLVRYYCLRFHRMKSVSIDLPEKGAAIVVANHVSGLDPFLLIAASRRPLRFLIAKEEYNRFGLKWLFKAVGCISVDRKRNSERSIREAMTALNAGEVVAIFPHGGIHWPIRQNAKLKGGAIRLAQYKSVPIYPVFIEGVKLKGFTVPPLFVRGQVDLTLYDPLLCESASYEECLENMAQLLNPPVN